MSAADGATSPHVFTVDVEEYFHVHALEPWVDREAWERYPSRVEASTDRLLRLLEGAGARATFFVLGWVAERRPGLVRRIADAGHEVASHGWSHRKVTELSTDQFRADVRRSRALLEELSGDPVTGYRAPSFSLHPDTRWMLDVLAEEGYRYDSSLFPSWRPAGRGAAGAPRRAFTVETGAAPLLELPLTTLRRFGVTLPAAGGAYLRHLPYGLIRAGLRQAERDGEPGVVYVHPWELDPEQPRFSVPPGTRLRHYGNLGRMEKRLERLTDEFPFTSVRDAWPRLADGPVAGEDHAGGGATGDDRRKADGAPAHQPSRTGTTAR